MPNRVIRESILTSSTIDELSAEGERFFCRLLLVADDFGRFEADPRVLLARCFPLKVGTMSLEAVVEIYHELEAAGLVRSYRAAGRVLGYFVNWERYNRLRARKSKYPAPEPVPARASADTCAHLPTHDNTCAHLRASADTCGQMSAYSESESESESEADSDARAREAPGAPGFAGAVAPEERPEDAPDPPPGGWLDQEQLEVLGQVLGKLRVKYPRFWPRLDQLVRGWMRTKPPWEVCQQVMASLLAHEARDPVPYARKILRVEEPNHHERAAIARHQALKDEEARERSAPTVALAQAELEQLDGPLAAVLGRISAKAKRNGRTCPEGSERQAVQVPVAPTG